MDWDSALYQLRLVKKRLLPQDPVAGHCLGSVLMAISTEAGWFGLLFFCPFVLTASDQSAYRTRPSMSPPRMKCMTGKGTAQGWPRFWRWLLALYSQLCFSFLIAHVGWLWSASMATSLLFIPAACLNSALLVSVGHPSWPATKFFL